MGSFSDLPSVREPRGLFVVCDEPRCVFATPGALGVGSAAALGSADVHRLAASHPFGFELSPSLLSVGVAH